MELSAKTAHELADLLADRQVSAVELTQSVLNRIQSVEPTLGAYLTLQEETTLAQAAEIDRRRTAGTELGPLAGIPVALKDNLCTDGVRTTCASKILETFVPPYDATVVSRLKAAGAVFTGKTNMDEFAMGSSTENSALKKTRNPWDTSRVPGGSSGGSAVAVAADEAILALGSDTGGSVRQPAAFCGVVGMKPTYGRVSRFGLIAFASSLDQIGPFAKDVEDCAILLSVIAGHDPLDSTSVSPDVPDYRGALRRGVKGLTVGLPTEYFAEGIDPGVKQSVMAAVRRLEAEGASVREVSMPHTEYALATYYLIAPAEASSNLARYDGVRYGHRTQVADDVITMFKHTRCEGFGDEVKRRIMLGTYALSAGYYDAYYLKAQKVRTLIRRDFEQALEQCDVLVTPTTPSVAFRMGEKTDNPMQMYLSDICTITVNLAGLPGLSVPCGLTTEGLPVGLQVIGKAFDEVTLLQVGYAVEQSCDFKRPVLVGGASAWTPNRLGVHHE